MLRHSNCVQFSATLWNVAHHTPLSMGFSKQGYWTGLSCTPPGDLPDPGIEPGSPALQADSLHSAPPGKPKEWWRLPADPQKLGEAGGTLPWSLE